MRPSKSISLASVGTSGVRPEALAALPGVGESGTVMALRPPQAPRTQDPPIRDRPIRDRPSLDSTPVPHQGPAPQPRPPPHRGGERRSARRERALYGIGRHWTRPLCQIGARLRRPAGRPTGGDLIL